MRGRRGKKTKDKRQKTKDKRQKEKDKRQNYSPCQIPMILLAN